MGRRKYTDEDLEAFVVQVAQRVEDAANRASPSVRSAGMGWYSVAHEEAKLLANESDLDVERTSAIIAALSPLTRWAGNLEDAWNVINGDNARHALPSNAEKARRIALGGEPDVILGGNKVRSFWRNIAYPLGAFAVTFDSWMARGSGIDEADVFNVYGVYDACVLGVKMAAENLGILPNQAQAIAWLVYIEDDRQRRHDMDDDLPTPM